MSTSCAVYHASFTGYRLSKEDFDKFLMTEKIVSNIKNPEKVNLQFLITFIIVVVLCDMTPEIVEGEKSYRLYTFMALTALTIYYFMHILKKADKRHLSFKQIDQINKSLEPKGLRWRVEHINKTMVFYLDLLYKNLPED